MCEQATIDQRGDVIDPVEIFGDPIERLQIAQPAFALFDIGLQHITLPALFAVPRGTFIKLCLDELRAGAGEKLVAQCVLQFGSQRRIARQIAHFQEGRADREILFAEPEAFLDRPAGMADLQPQIPKHIERGLNDAFDLAGHLPGGDEQQIHI